MANNPAKFENCLRRLGEQDRSFTSVGLSGLELNSEEIETFVKALEALEDNTFLQNLDLRFNNFGNTNRDALRKLATVIQTLPNLKTLQLNDNRLDIVDNDALITFAAAIEHALSLTTLYLAYNKLGNASNGAFITLATAIQHAQNIEVVDLSHNNLSRVRVGDDAFIAFTTAIQHASNLKSLNLSSTKLGNNEASALAKALAKNSSLQKLKLDENDIGDEGTAAFNALLENGENFTLHKVQGINLSGEAQAALARNKQIHDALAAAEKVLNPETTDEVDLDDADAVASVPTPNMDELTAAITGLQAALDSIELIDTEQAQTKRDELYQAIGKCYQRKAYMDFDAQESDKAIDTCLTVPAACPQTTKMRQDAFREKLMSLQHDSEPGPAFFQALLHCISKDTDILTHLTSGESEFDMFLTAASDSNQSITDELTPQQRIDILNSVVDANTQPDSTHPVAKTSSLFASEDDAENIAKLRKAIAALSPTAVQEDTESATATTTATASLGPGSSNG